MEITPYLNIFIGLLLLTCFVKVLLSLSILRVGLGLNSASVGLVVLALSLALSFLIMEPHLNGFLSSPNLSSPSALPQLQERLAPFLEKNSDPAVKQSVQEMRQKLTPAPTIASQAGSAEAQAPVAGVALSKGAATQTLVSGIPPSMSVLITSFLLTELKEGLELGILILIPFVVIDLLIGNLLVLLGVTSISSEMIALPCKLLLFFAIDGWAMITQKIINGYAS